MGKIIKTWEYPNYNQIAKLVLRDDTLIEIFKDRQVFHSFEDVLKDNFIKNDLETTLELLQTIATIPNIKGLSEVSAKHLNFWKHYSPGSNFEVLTLERGSKEGDQTRYFIEFSPWGMREKTVYSSNGQCYFTNMRRPDLLFFYGPVTHSIDLNTRMKIRAELFKNLGLKPPFSSAQSGFILFDYNKIVHKKWEIYVTDYQHDELEINSGYVTVSGRDGRDSGETKYSCEQVWYFTDRHIPPVLNHNNAELLSILKSAIINEE
jgi:hypothetical protein